MAWELFVNLTITYCSEILSSIGHGEDRGQVLTLTILNECFPPTQFTVIPQYTTTEAQVGGIGAIDFAIIFVIEPLNHESPVFFIEIKPPTHLSSMLARKGANNQVQNNAVWCKRYG